MGALGEFDLVFEESPNPGRHGIVRARGEIDLSNADEFEGVLVQAWEETYVDVVVDLSQVRFLGSNGLNALIMARNRIRDGGGEIQLRQPSPPARRTLEVTGLASAFKFED